MNSMAGDTGVKIEGSEDVREREGECRGDGADDVCFLLIANGRGGSGRFLSHGGDGDLEAPDPYPDS